MTTQQIVYHGDIDKEWHWIEPILRSLVEKREYPRHTVEYLRGECDSGRAQLFLCSLDPLAFGIVAVCVDEVNSERNLHLLVAHTTKSLQRGMIPIIKGVAELLGCSKVTMKSNRRGFLRSGWKLAGYCYEMEV